MSLMTTGTWVCEQGIVGVVLTPPHVCIETRPEKPTVEDGIEGESESTGPVAGGDRLQHAERCDDLRVRFHMRFHVSENHRAHARARRRETEQRHRVRIGKNVKLDQLRRKIHVLVHTPFNASSWSPLREGARTRVRGWTCTSPTHVVPSIVS